MNRLRQHVFYVATIFTISIFGISNIQSQAIYEVPITLVGDIYINGTWQDSSFSAVSRDCVVKLDYETGEFIALLEKSSLTTDRHELNEFLSSSGSDQFKYEGKLGVEIIRTSAHPTEEFSVEGYLNCAPHNDRITGYGVIEHIFGDVYSCILNMSFDIDLTKIFSSNELGEFGNNVRVEIMQAILKRNDE